MNLIRENILSKIILDIKNAKYSSIMMDELVNVFRHEQVSLTIRYTDNQFRIYECFVGFERVASTTDGIC